jgi:hypothetical protein
LVRKREGKRPLERPRHRRVGGGLVWCGLDWSGSG